MFGFLLYVSQHVDAFAYPVYALDFENALPRVYVLGLGKQEVSWLSAYTHLEDLYQFLLQLLI